MDRGLVHVGSRRLRSSATPPLVVDLGYGAAATTTVELHRRLCLVRPDVEVVGVEIDPDRVAAAQPFARPGLRFVRGGFDLPLPHPPLLVRAANVLRQYDEDEVAGAWALLRRRAADDALILEGTCDEIGRRSTWVILDAGGPRSFTLSVALTAIERPSDIAERLPKALIHRNVPGEPIHAYLQAADAAWERAAPLASYGRRQRFIATARALREQGWPILDGEKRWRLGELAVAWDAVAPRDR